MKFRGGMLATVAVAVSVFSTGALAACTRDAYGNVRCADGSTCMATRTGEIRCAKNGGGIAINREGEARCGVGQCIADSKGDVHCSNMAGGGVTLDSRGAALCDEGCRPGSGTMCSMSR